MKLERLTERIWYTPFEEKRDRPNLGYIRGDRFSVAVDAGHSAAHTQEFYTALVENGFPLPAVTVLTHWHWDHTFALHAIHGISISNERTKQYLEKIRSRIEREGTDFVFAMSEHIGMEYADGRPIVVTLPDLVFTGSMEMDAGNCCIRLLEAESPHTDDSTLVHIPGENALFVGDSCCGVSSPDWRKDPDQSRKLAETIRRIGAGICLDGHWTPMTADEKISDLLDFGRN